MKIFLAVLMIFLLNESLLMAQDNAPEDTQGVWHDENGVDLPINSKNQVIPRPVPVVPSVPERQVKPEILDDNAKFNTTVAG